MSQALLVFKQVNKSAFSNVWDLAVTPEQVPYVCGDLEEYVQGWIDDPLFDCFLVEEANVPVGFFAIDLNTERHADYIAKGDMSCVLRCFLIDRRHQGRGLAHKVLTALGPFIRATYPEIRDCILRVNFKNEVAIRSYLRAGFRHHGAPFLGRSGPQHVMRKQLFGATMASHLPMD